MKGTQPFEGDASLASVPFEGLRSLHFLGLKRSQLVTSVMRL
jgi:hypothetical protein